MTDTKTDQFIARVQATVHLTSVQARAGALDQLRVELAQFSPADRDRIRAAQFVPGTKDPLVTAINLSLLLNLGSAYYGGILPQLD